MLHNNSSIYCEYSPFYLLKERMESIAYNLNVKMKLYFNCFIYNNTDYPNKSYAKKTLILNGKSMEITASKEI